MTLVTEITTLALEKATPGCPEHLGPDPRPFRQSGVTSHSTKVSTSRYAVSSKRMIESKILEKTCKMCLRVWKLHIKYPPILSAYPPIFVHKSELRSSFVCAAQVKAYILLSGSYNNLRVFV